MDDGKTFKILMVGLDDIMFEVCRLAWLDKNGILYRANNLSDCMKEVSINKYHLISSVLPDGENERLSFINQLKILRDMTTAPIVIYIHGAYEPELYVKVIENGADDFQVCPPTIEAAVATGKSLIRRYTDLNNRTEKPATLAFSENIIISATHYKVFVKGQEVELLPKEFEILRLLIENPRRVFTYEQIFEEVWGEEYAYSARKNLRNQIMRLRKKIQLSNFIKTKPGVGYSFEP